MSRLMVVTGGGVTDWYGLLECPVCRARLTRTAGALTCAVGHCFDIGRQGYVNLLPGGADPGTADTAEMVRARAAFLATEHYRPLVDALAARIAGSIDGAPGCVIDAGAGTGEYLAAVLDTAPSRTGLALDISKYAARLAAHAHPRMGAVVCDIWEPWPVRDGVAAAVMSIFSPRNAQESARVLALGGALVVVTPTVRHLHELIEPLGMISVDPSKAERISRSLGGLFTLEQAESLEERIVLSPDDAVALVSMGPSARHTTPGRVREQAATLGETIGVTISFDVATWLKRGPD